jgi:hypothetical protein
MLEEAAPERTIFTGAMDHEHLHLLVPLADAVVVPSVLPEAFGMVAAEAAACGVVPIVARHSGLAEVARTLAEARDEAVLRRLRAIVDEQKRLARAKDLDGFAAADQDFHRTLYEAAGVPDLWGLVCRNSGHIDRLRRLHLPVEGKAGQIVREHMELIEAIAAGDPELAQRRLREHLASSLAFGAELRARFPGYFRA